QWRDAHILSPHLRDQLLDLLAIRTFVHPCPWPVPGSLTSAFARTLAFIAAWDWQTDPLIVDLNNELTKEDVEGIHTRFQAWRNLDPGMNRVALFAASNIDRESGITWTDRARPAKVVAARFTKLARAASQLVKEQGLELDPETLFVPSFTEYDFLIHLKHKHNSKESSYKNLRIEAKKAGGEDPFEGICNPAERFVEELEELYGDCIVFFYNRSGGAGVVAGLWNPQTTGAREWKVGLGYSTMPVSADGDGNGDTEQRSRVAINKEAVLHDIARLGGDLVRRIDGKASS
ncbi:MAG: hypothetical protein L6R39_005060, partial [Caloplaca ligustica]